MNQEEMLTQIMNELSTMNKRFDKVDERLDKMDGRLDKMDANINRIEETTETTRQIVARMEIEHGQKLGALFDANSMNYDKIKDEITPILEKHDEDIEKLKIHVSGLRRVK